MAFSLPPLPPRAVVLGGGGFLGGHLVRALGDRGWRVDALDRRAVDLTTVTPEALADRLRGAALVINATGVPRGRRALEALHDRGVDVLLEAMERAEVRRLIHLSALGADPGADTAFQRAKGRAEAKVRAPRRLEAVILRPSLVLGRGGASLGFLSALAALPWPPRLGPGTWRVQPLHPDDLAGAVIRLAEARPGSWPDNLDLVGPEPLTTDALLALLRRWLGLPARRPLPLPEGGLLALAHLGPWLLGGPTDPEMVRLLRAGNTGDPAPLTRLLGRPPRPLAEALARHPASPADRLAARMLFLRPVLRLSLAVLWILTGVLSLGVHPLADSLGLLASLGLEGPGAWVALGGGAALDLTLGLLLLLGIRPLWTLGAMLASVGIFTLFALGLPEALWTHPFAPLLKNGPVAAAILTLMALEADHGRLSVR
jgi:uncharacterized protein YbjT (DUF2867 family)